MIFNLHIFSLIHNNLLNFMLLITFIIYDQQNIDEKMCNKACVQFADKNGMDFHIKKCTLLACHKTIRDPFKTIHTLESIYSYFG